MNDDSASPTDNFFVSQKRELTSGRAEKIQEREKITAVQWGLKNEKRLHAEKVIRQTVPITTPTRR